MAGFVIAVCSGRSLWFEVALRCLYRKKYEEYHNEPTPSRHCSQPNIFNIFYIIYNEREFAASKKSFSKCNIIFVHLIQYLQYSYDEMDFINLSET